MVKLCIRLDTEEPTVLNTSKTVSPLSRYNNEYLMDLKLTKRGLKQYYNDKFKHNGPAFDMVFN